MKIHPILLGAVILQGCMTLPVKGKVENSDEYFTGTATGNLFGTGSLKIVSSNSSICEGDFVYKIPHRLGKGDFKCNDGREGPFQFESTCTSGSGYGNLGKNHFTFSFGKNLPQVHSQEAVSIVTPETQSIAPTGSTSRNKGDLLAENRDSNLSAVSSKTEVLTSSEEFNEVQMTKNGGVYMLPASINDVLSIKFIIDSGASDVSISPDIALTLIKTETITINDFLPGQAYKLADGSIAKSNRFKLHSLRVGASVIKNIPCSISNSINAPLLLGQSALEQLGSFTFDYDKSIVRFHNKPTKSK